MGRVSPLQADKGNASGSGSSSKMLSNASAFSKPQWQLFWSRGTGTPVDGGGFSLYLCDLGRKLYFSPAYHLHIFFKLKNGLKK